MTYAHLRSCMAANYSCTQRIREKQVRDLLGNIALVEDELAIEQRATTMQQVRYEWKERREERDKSVAGCVSKYIQRVGRLEDGNSWCCCAEASGLRARIHIFLVHLRYSHVCICLSTLCCSLERVTDSPRPSRARRNFCSAN